MALRDALRRLLGRAEDGGDAVRVRVLLKGRAGTGWYDCDEQVVLPRGAKLAPTAARTEPVVAALAPTVSDEGAAETAEA